MKARNSIVPCALILCLSLNCAAKGNIESEVNAFLIKQVEETGAPSLSVSAGRAGEVLFSIAQGVANKSTGKKADKNTQYRTGSVSKVIGTTAFMRLVGAEKIKLTDGIRQYLPYLPAHYDKIQIRHILTHTSGIRHYRYGEYGTNIHYPTLRDATKVFRDDALLFVPGSRYQYSTYGINLIQGIIESVTQKTLSEFMNEALFIPLNMSNTELEVKGEETSQYAVGYRSFMSSYQVKDIDVSNKYIGGGMRTTPEDLVTMVQAINSGKVVNDTMRNLMLTVPFPEVANDRALGWRWLEYKGVKAFAHTGAINGFVSFLAHFVDEDITIAIMVNQDDYDYTGATSYKLLEIVRSGLEIVQQDDN